MSLYASSRIKGEPDTSATGTSKIDINSIRKYASVTLFSDGWRYSGDNDIVHGSLYGVSSKYLQICVHGQGIKFKNSGTSPIVLNSRIIGAQRNIGGTLTNGYIKAYVADIDGTDPNTIDYNDAFDEINLAAKARGIVVNGGKSNTANQDHSADILVSLQFGLVGY